MRLVVALAVAAALVVAAAGCGGDKPQADPGAFVQTLLRNFEQGRTVTAHVFESGRAFAWVIGPVDYASYQAGRCPS